MAFTYPQIIELAKRSGIPFTVVSTLRPGARTLSGEVSWRASGRAVDFGGYSQDALATYFMSFPTLEVIHHSNKTGKNYASKNGQTYDLTSHPALLEQHRNHLHVAMSEEQVTNVPKNNVLDLLGKLPNPFTAAAGVADVLRPIGIAGSNIINPSFWRRIGMGVVGGGLIFVGLLYLNRRPIENAARAVGGAVGSLASTTAQGAAFGVGAGATGGVSAAGTRAISGGPPRTPRPPAAVKRGSAPVSATPRTSPLPPELYAPKSPGGTYTVTGKAKRPPAPLPTMGKPKSGLFKGEK